MLLVAAGGAAAQPCQLLQIGEFHVKMDGTKPLLTAQINDHSIPMLVDSGSDTSLLWNRTAAALNLKITALRGVRFYGVGGGNSVGSVTVPHVTLDGYTVDNVHLLVTGTPRPAEHFAGVLGEDFLSQTDVEFDFRSGVIRLFQPKNCSGDQVVYWRQPYSLLPIESSAKNRLRIHVLLNGTQIVAALDTGASVTTVTSQAARKAGVRPGSDGVAYAGSANGLGPKAVETYVAVFPTFSIADETIQNAKMGIADLFGLDKDVSLGSRIPAPTIDTPEMLLGMDFFLSHRVYVARGQGKIYFSYLGGPVFRLEPRSPAAAKPGAGADDSAPP
jgi:predicted aspartyl protease